MQIEKNVPMPAKAPSWVSSLAGIAGLMEVGDSVEVRGHRGDDVVAVMGAATGAEFIAEVSRLGHVRIWRGNGVFDGAILNRMKGLIANGITHGVLINRMKRVDRIVVEAVLSRMILDNVVVSEGIQTGKNGKATTVYHLNGEK